MIVPVCPSIYLFVVFQRSERQRSNLAPVPRTDSNGFKTNDVTTNHCQREEGIEAEPSDNIELKPMIISPQSLEYKRINGGELGITIIQKMKSKVDLIRLRKSKEASCYMLLSIVLLFILTHSFRLAFKIYEILIPNGITYENYDRCYTMGR